jgi:hypothetical protein
MNIMVDKVYSERVDGETPNGGTYSIAYFQNNEGKRTTKDKATKIEIIEFDTQDNIINRTYTIKNTNA